MIFEKLIHRKKDVLELESYKMTVIELYHRLDNIRRIVKNHHGPLHDIPVFIGQESNRILSLIEVYKSCKFALPTTMMSLSEKQLEYVQITENVITNISILATCTDIEDVDMLRVNAVRSYSHLIELSTAMMWNLEYDYASINMKIDIIDHYYKRKHRKMKKSIITVKYVMPDKEYLNSIQGGNQNVTERKRSDSDGV